MTRRLVYIASPYTKGDPCANARFQCEMFDKLLNDGRVLPYIPLWSHFQHTMFPRPYTDWINYDLEFIREANFVACLRLNATCESMRMPDGSPYLITQSSGADGEEKLFRELGKPVFYTVEALYEWLDRIAR